MSNALGQVPAPVSDRIVNVRRKGFKDGEDPLEGYTSMPWREYFTQIGMAVDLAPSRIAYVTLEHQDASIGATDMSAGDLAAGHYRVSYYTRITQAATTSSSLTISFDWLDETLSCSYSGGAITSNVTTATQSGTQLIYIDKTAPFRYSTTYASVGGTPMKYKLCVTLERVLL